LIEHSVVIERPLFDVFDYLMDVQRMWEWVPFCLNSKVLEIDELQWPTRYEARAGFTWEISYTTEVAITDVRRGRSVSFRQAEPPQMAIYTLQPTPTGTIVTATHSPWTTLLLAPLEGSFDVLLREYVSNALENLKKVLEARPPVSRPVVFLSYRRESSEYVAGRICEAIARDFGEAALFRDLDTIRAGENPYAAIDAGLADCAAMIVLIDPTWLESIERRREDGEKDYVLLEIEAGLRSNKLVLPVALANVDIERVREHLPPEVSALRDMQWQLLRHDPDFTPDMNRIVEAIWQVVMKGGPSHKGDPEMEAPRRTGAPAWDAMLSGAMQGWSDFARRMMARNGP